MSDKEKQEDWEYHETHVSAYVRVSDGLILRPMWRGTRTAEELRAVMKRTVVAVNAHDSLIEAIKDAIAFIESNDTYSTDPGVKVISDKLAAALLTASNRE